MSKPLILYLVEAPFEPEAHCTKTSCWHSFYHQGRTCKPALGHSFAAGTTDGGGEFDFTQGKDMSYEFHKQI